MPKDDEMTVKDAAAKLGVSRETIRQYCIAGILKFRSTPGGHRRIIRDSVTKAAGDAPRA